MPLLSEGRKTVHTFELKLSSDEIWGISITFRILSLFREMVTSVFKTMYYLC